MSATQEHDGFYPAIVSAGEHVRRSKQVGPVCRWGQCAGVWSVDGHRGECVDELTGLQLADQSIAQAALPPAVCVEGLAEQVPDLLLAFVKGPVVVEEPGHLQELAEKSLLAVLDFQEEKLAVGGPALFRVRTGCACGHAHGDRDGVQVTCVGGQLGERSSGRHAVAQAALSALQQGSLLFVVGVGHAPYRRRRGDDTETPAFAPSAGRISPQQAYELGRSHVIALALASG